MIDPLTGLEDGVEPWGLTPLEERLLEEVETDHLVSHGTDYCSDEWDVILADYKLSIVEHQERLRQSLERRLIDASQSDIDILTVQLSLIEALLLLRDA